MLRGPVAQVDRDWGCDLTSPSLRLPAKCLRGSRLNVNRAPLAAALHRPALRRRRFDALVHYCRIAYGNRRLIFGSAACRQAPGWLSSPDSLVLWGRDRVLRRARKA